MELIDIWRHVVAKRPQARLAMIGNGPLEEEAREKVRKYGIQDKVDFFGFLDGEAKFDIFRQSKLVVHPATFDSGGMAAAEAMAWKLPGVSFDLEALKSYYPKGMVKVSKGDIRGFADAVCGLLNDRTNYERLSQEALDLIMEKWDWKVRAQELYKGLFKEEK